MRANIIDEVSVELLEKELNETTFLRKSNKGGNELYVVDAHTAPNAMREIGRLRELAFRAGGGGTGLDCDIDEFDTMTPPCRQLVVWDPESRQIIGGYRFILGRDMMVDEAGRPRIAVSHLFNFSPEFMRDYLPYTIELGRSFVRVEAQATRQSKVIFALDNLWDGLGALTVLHPEIKYLFGKVTMYPEYITECRDMILYFLHKHFPDHNNLVTPIEPLPQTPDLVSLAKAFPVGTSFKEDYKHLNKKIREYGINIPPLVNAYMNLSPTMKVFGTAINREFGDVEETGILITIDDIFDEKKKRHIETFDGLHN